MRIICTAAMLGCLVSAAACGSSYNSGPTGPSQEPIAAGPNIVLVPSGTASSNRAPGYAPTPLTVAAGTTVTFGNNDGTSHTATADNGAWNVSLAPGQTGTAKLTTPGMYTYHCTIHAFMTGTIVVQ
jgi:OOP family OmpA-OmpF porin